ncbi:hypothetical protein AWJ20_607 [Sugiyamaella lignohabitans]|uniref:Uncharacterized protein n=1 Tax=Sugiyamaella lignohabitans TaxID=796027 RepID=A0A161HIK5_9ASCO|nr:uncharacterized protein AWJ20_607 [Sugiyamaella lignohabitans]ANB12357.1 hypothetical protein AWJ20_607 [Sugiyamaella lignohabitans]
MGSFLRPQVALAIRRPLANSNVRLLSTSRIAFQEAKTSAVTEAEKTEEVQEFETISGAPADLTTNRIVRIFQESKATNKRDFKVKVYADNFFHSSGKLKHIRTK